MNDLIWADEITIWALLSPGGNSRGIIGRAQKSGYLKSYLKFTLIVKTVFYLIGRISVLPRLDWRIISLADF